MAARKFPVIDMAATGANIIRLRKERGLTVRDLQAYFGFEEPQAIYKWQRGKSLPSVDNLYALGVLLNVPMEAILVSFEQSHSRHLAKIGQQAEACCPILFLIGSFEYNRRPDDGPPILPLALRGSFAKTLPPSRLSA